MLASNGKNPQNGRMRVVRMGQKAALLEDLDRDPCTVARGLMAAAPFPGLEEAVPCYDSVGLYFTAWPGEDALVRGLATMIWPEDAFEIRSHQVTIRYDGPDLLACSALLGLPVEQLIEGHLSGTYTVRAIGFSPGFPYLEGLPAELCGLPRLSQPRARVPAGSIGITGNQTCIYPMSTPGGWHLIGTTDDLLVDLSQPWFRFQVGDEVRFVQEGA